MKNQKSNREAFARKVSSMVHCDKYEHKHVTAQLCDDIVADVKERLRLEHPNTEVRKVDIEQVTNPYNINLNVEVFDTSLADKPVCIEVPILYLYV